MPDVLLSGNHAKIKEWRLEQSILLTKKERPDLFAKHAFSKEEMKIVKRLKEEGKL